MREWLKTPHLIRKVYSERQGRNSLLSAGKVLLVVAIFLGISVYANFSYSNILDPDSLYHIRHAWIYQTNGIFDSAFPWTQFSAIKEAGADLWYGFHLTLIPLTYLSDFEVAIEMASVLITFLALVSVYAALKNIAVKHAELWTAFFFFSTPSLITRMTMARPHPLSLGLTALIFSFFIKGPVVLILLFSFLLGWIHSSVFWLPILAVGSLVIFQKLNRRRIDIRKIVIFGGGIAAGLMARPHPLANLKLIYIQVVELYFAKSNELAQIIGAELKPPDLASIYTTQKWLLITLLAALIYLAQYVYKKNYVDAEKKIILSSVIALVALSTVMYATAVRAIDQLAMFIVIFAGSVFSLPYLSRKPFQAVKNNFAAASIIVLLTGFSAYNLSHTNFNPSHSPNKFKESALWLKENTEEKSIVYYLNWGYFPFLFFWNQDNYYINGMDPVFLLKYDEKLYWKLYNMAVNENDKKKHWRLDDVAVSKMGGITCSFEPKKCGPKDIENVSDVIRNDFRASYVFVTERNKALFSEYLEEDVENFEKIYENKAEGVMIFKVI